MVTKYHNHKTVHQGVRFDSQKEAKRYQELILMERAGLIRSIELQPRYDLIVNGHKLGFYKGDFRYEVVATSIMIGEDVKSPATKTAVYCRKQEARQGIVWNRDHRGVRITGLHIERKKSSSKSVTQRKEAKAMQLVEKHVIERDDPRYKTIDAAAFASKNVYNATLYIVRQVFIGEGEYLNYNTMNKIMKKHEAYRALPTKVAQMVVKQVHEAWVSFFEACKEYREHPEKFTGRPRLPKDKTSGRNLLQYNMQAVSRGKRTRDRGIIKPSQLGITVKTRQDPRSINEVRIAPKKEFYVVEIVYTKAEKQTKLKYEHIAGIDLGVNNLVALASNKPGFIPVVVNGRPVKSTNQYYNKRRAELQKALGHTGTTTRMERMTTKRNRRIEQYMHTTSKRVIDLLVSEGIGTLVIGKNDGWKQEVNMGRQNNQSFCFIPHAKLIAMLTYKAELVGIKVVLTEESYTSAASLLDLDALPVYDPKRTDKPKFSGKRIKRGLYRAKDGRIINADINGAGNTIRKVAPNAFGSKGVEDGKARFSHALVVHPVRKVIVPSRNQKEKS